MCGLSLPISDNPLPTLSIKNKTTGRPPSAVADAKPCVTKLSSWQFQLSQKQNPKPVTLGNHAISGNEVAC